MTSNAKLIEKLTTHKGHPGKEGNERWCVMKVDDIINAVIEALPNIKEFTSSDPIFTDTPSGKAGYNLCLSEIKQILEKP